MKVKMVDGELVMTAEDINERLILRAVHRETTTGEGSHLWEAWTNGRTIKLKAVGSTEDEPID